MRGVTRPALFCSSRADRALAMPGAGASSERWSSLPGLLSPHQCRLGSSDLWLCRDLCWVGRSLLTDRQCPARSARPPHVGGTCGVPGVSGPSTRGEHLAPPSGARPDIVCLRAIPCIALNLLPVLLHLWWRCFSGGGLLTPVGVLASPRGHAGSARRVGERSHPSPVRLHSHARLPKLSLCFDISPGARRLVNMFHSAVGN